MKQKRINIILSIAVVIILLLIAGSVLYLHRRIESEIITLYGEKQVLLASQISSKFESYFQSRGQSLRVLSSFESLRRRIPKQIKDDVNSHYSYVRLYLVNSIFVLDENGKIIYSTVKNAIGRDCRNYEFWGKMIQSIPDSLIYIPIDTSLKDLFNKNVSMILSPIYDKDKFLGAVAYTVEIDSLINSFLKGTGQLYGSWLISSDRILIFHSSHPEMVLRRAQLKEQECSRCHISFDYVDTMLAKGSGVIRYSLKNYPEKFAGFSHFKLGEEDLVFVASVPFEKVKEVFTDNAYLIYLLLILTFAVLVVYGFIFLRNTRDIIRAGEKRKQIEEESRIYRLYNLLFQNSNDGVYILDLEEGKFVEINKKFQEMFGYTQEELNNIDFIQLVAPESRPMILERREKIARGVPVPQRYAFTALAKDGRKIDVEVSVSYIRFGEKMYVLGIYRDISEVLSQKELYQNLFESLPVGVVIHQDGKIVKCNKKAVEIGGGKTEDDIVGRPVLDFIHPDFREIIEERIRGIIEEGKPASPIEEKFVKLDGSIIDVMVMESRIMWEGRPAVQVVVEDITEKKQKEKEVLTLQKFEALGQLASGIAHDFNNVLAIITGMLELASMKTEDKNILDYIERALSAARRGAEITRRLLQFSKRKAEEFKPISIRELVLDTVRILEHSIPKTISIRTEIARDFTVFGSYGDLQQVILNLSLNACDAMPKGGKLTFWISSVDKDFIEKRFMTSARSDFYVSIAVSDTGVGISEDLKDKIFEPFFTTKGAGKGTGLGLSIVKNVVTIHNGFVDFESIAGKGTTFYVYLPVYSKEEKEVKTYRGEEKMGKISKGYKVLIVEDEESLRVIMRDYLETFGFTVIEAEDAEIALERFEENPDVKIIFVDYGIPKMMGDELIRRIYSISPSVKFVLTTGFIDVELEESLPSGIKIMRKPYNLSQIESVVKELMEETQ